MKTKSIKVNAILSFIHQCMNALFPLITYPYVSRVLGADNLGRYSFSDSVVQLLITLSLLGIPTYAIREGSRIRDNKKELSDFCAEVLTINFVSTFLCYVILGVLILFVPRIRVEMVLILILSINMLGKFVGRDWLNTIYEEYLYISIRVIVVRFLALVAMFVFVRTRNDLIRYVTIMGTSQLGTNVLNVFYTSKMIPMRIKISREVLKHLKPIMLLFCTSVAIAIYVRSDITILGFLRPDSEVGIYSVTSRIYIIIKGGLLAIISVAIPRLSFLLGKGGSGPSSEYNKLLNSTKEALMLVLLPAVVGLFCLSQEVMLIVGGKEFDPGSTALKILCVAMFFSVLTTFYSQGVLITNRKETAFFVATSVSALLNIVINLIIIPTWGMNGAAFTTVISEVCCMVICRCYSRGIYYGDNKSLLKNLLSAGIESALIIIISFAVHEFSKAITARVLLTVVPSVCLYPVVLTLTGNEMYKTVAAGVRKKIGKILTGRS